MAVQASLCLAWSESPEDTFSHGVAHLIEFHLVILVTDVKYYVADNVVLATITGNDKNQ